jgi:hypothetical protein
VRNLFSNCAKFLSALVIVVCFAGGLFAQTQINTASLPGAVIGVQYPPQALSASGGTAPYTWSISSGSLPTGLALTTSVSTGDTIAGIPSGTEGTSNFILTVTDSTLPTHQQATRSLSIIVSAPLSITTSLLPVGKVGVTYAASTLTAVGGTQPYAWAIISGSLPPGLFLLSGGVISGTPSIAGTFTVTVRAADSGIPAQTATQSLTIQIPPVITTTSLPNGLVNTAYSQTLIAGPTTATPLTWSVSAGSLPPGLSITDATNGIIGGTPTASGTFNFTISVTDSSVPALTASMALTIVIQPALAITQTSPLPVGVVGVFYSQAIATSGASPVTLTVFSGILPPGITLTSTGSLAGTPAVAGAFDFTLQAAAASPAQTATQAFHIVINAALSITTLVLPDATLSSPYTQTLAATGGVPIYTWTNPGRGLPAGISLSTSGVISGTPTAPGSFTFTLQVSDSFTPTQTVSKTFTLVVASALTITTISLPDAIQNVAYSQQFQFKGGTAPFTWLATAGTLPAGLTLTTAGVLQGTPTAPDSEDVTFTLTDSRGASTSLNLVIVVESPVPSLSLANFPSTLNPAQQSQIQLSLPASRPYALSGTLTLTFTSKAQVPSDDPMTQFSTGSRTLTFTIPANSTGAVFSSSQVLLLTGTVAGTINITASFPNGIPNMLVATTEIPAIAPQITNVKATRTTGGLDVQITGYASARRVTNVEFIFDVKVGSTIQQIPPLSRSVDADFAAWYQNTASSVFGSAFSFLQSFVIQDPSVVQDVTVRLTNAQGSTTISSVAFK